MEGLIARFINLAFVDRRKWITPGNGKPNFAKRLKTRTEFYTGIYRKIIISPKGKDGIYKTAFRVGVRSSLVGITHC